MTAGTVSSSGSLEFSHSGTLRGASIILGMWPWAVRNYVSVCSGLYRPKWRPSPEGSSEEPGWGWVKERIPVTSTILCVSSMKAGQHSTQGHIPGEWSSHAWPPEFLAMSLWLLAYCFSPWVCPLTSPPPHPHSLFRAPPGG